jgi:hypothetical protein
MQNKRSELRSAILAATMVLAIVGVALGAPMQRPYYRFANGHGYVVYKAPAANSSATAAEVDAVAAGGHLVTVNDAAEDAFIRATFDGTVNPGVASDGFGSVAGYWIGLTDDVAFGRTEGNFGWMNGEAVSYTNWAGTNPDNFGGAENFVGKGANGVANSGQWIDVPGVFGGSVAGVAELSTPRAVADTFGGTAGASLNGTATSVGGQTWAATHAIFSTAASDPGTVTPSTAASRRLMADTPLDTTGNVGLISVQTDLKINSANAGSGTWSFIGLLQNSLDVMRPDQGAVGDSVSLRVDASGTLNLFAINDGVTIRNEILGTVSGWARGNYYNVQLVYDPSNASVDAYVNNILMGSDILLGFTPQIGYAGLQAEKFNTGNNIGNNAVWFDNFASMVVTPEPATALFLAIGGLMLIRRKR